MRRQVSGWCNVERFDAKTTEWCGGEREDLASVQFSRIGQLSFTARLSANGISTATESFLQFAVDSWIHKGWSSGLRSRTKACCLHTCDLHDMRCLCQVAAIVTQRF